MKSSTASVSNEHKSTVFKHFYKQLSRYRETVPGTLVRVPDQLTQTVTLPVSVTVTLTVTVTVTQV